MRRLLSQFPVEFNLASVMRDEHRVGLALRPLRIRTQSRREGPGPKTKTKTLPVASLDEPPAAIESIGPAVSWPG